MTGQGPSQEILGVAWSCVSVCGGASVHAGLSLGVADTPIVKGVAGINTLSCPGLTRKPIFAEIARTVGAQSKIETHIGVVSLI